MAQISIIYGSTTGNTESVANIIGKELSSVHQVKIVDISKVQQEDFTSPDLLIIGTSTWGMGELQDDWLFFEEKISSLALQGKKVAFFGLGDQEGYPETFVDAMGLLYQRFVKQGIELVGAWKAEEINYDFSQAELDKGVFAGLALDEDNQSDKSERRIKEWCHSISANL